MRKRSRRWTKRKEYGGEEPVKAEDKMKRWGEKRGKKRSRKIMIWRRQRKEEEGKEQKE